MFYILNNMFPTVSNGNMNSQYKTSNLRLERPTNEHQNYLAMHLHKNGQNSLLNNGMNLNKPLSSRNTAVIRSCGEIRKSKYSIVKTGVPRSTKNVYKWENKSVTSEPVKLPPISGTSVHSSSVCNSTSGYDYQKVTSNITVEENISKNHFRSPIPFHSYLFKGWFSVPPCSISCINSTLFDLRSCCFISKRFLPANTLTLKSFQGAGSFNAESKKADIENTPALLTKHKLIRKPQPKLLKNNSSVVLCTKNKLVRESVPSRDQIMLPSRDQQPNVSELKTINKLSSDVQSLTPVPKKHVNLPLVVLTDRKLIRDTECSVYDCTEKSSTITSPTKLIRVNHNKLIRSSLLPKFTKRSTQNYVTPIRSVLSHMIQYRRRPYPGSSYVLLTRNKLVRRVRYKNRVWKNSANSAPKLLSKKVLPKVFVAVGGNKLIRKSLFTKTNKVSLSKNGASTVSPLKNKMLTRMLDSPGRRVQRFTNHLSRRKLKYLANSSTRISRNRFSNKCKNNKRILRRKNSICPTFRRKGECHKKTDNKCPYLHDTKYIMICKNYLRNSCEDEKCLLSHDLIPQKAPVCLHFLNSNCEASQCPFLHVKLDPKAPVCAHFLNGYCEAADKCTSWHIYACPQYKSCGKCDAESCHLPHRDSEYFEGKCTVSEDGDEENGIMWRYFEKNKLDEKDLSGVQIIPNRCSLGILPDYIPL